MTAPNTPTPELVTWKRFDYSITNERFIETVNGSFVLHSEAADAISRLTAERDGFEARLTSCDEAAEKRVKELEGQLEQSIALTDDAIKAAISHQVSNKLLSERVAVLETALEPFAKAADQRQVMCDDTERVTWSDITVGDLRRARAAREAK